MNLNSNAVDLSARQKIGMFFQQNFWMLVILLLLILLVVINGKAQSNEFKKAPHKLSVYQVKSSLPSETGNILNRRQ